MLAQYFNAANFLAAMQAHLPRGRVWSRDSDAIQTKVLTGLAPSYERQTARSNYLLVDAFPTTTYELLPEWESTLGLPDPCAGTEPTIQQRRSQVVARITAKGGQSAPYFKAYALALGYEIDVVNYAPARIGISRCGDAANSEDWAFAWSIQLPLSTVVYARVGISSVGEPLATWGNTVLQCEFESIKPAHSTLLFQYLFEIFDNSVVDDFGHPVITADGFPVVI
jgi:uncharacterized protein YmfQ (DUF2313 family)